MANTDTPFGLRPVRHRNGTPWNGKVRPYFIPSTYATALYIGDPVVKTGTSNTARVAAPQVGTFAIGTLPEVNKATAGDGNAITGVIVGFATNPDSLGTVYGAASTARVAMVCDDPSVVFEIQADGAIPAASVGLNAVLIYTHAGSNFTGLSGAELDTTSDAPAADASNQLTILRIVNREDNTPNLIHNKVEVAINQHTEATGAIGI
jgi:hypothetical protein